MHPCQGPKMFQLLEILFMVKLYFCTCLVSLTFTFSFSFAKMKFQDLSVNLVLAISLSFLLAGGKEYPKWPWDFKFSIYGPVSGYHCVELSELVPLYYFWFDNHFCVRNGSNFKNIGMLWTAMGKLHIFLF